MEKALRLDQADRQRLQVALTSLGFDTRGNDGIFGPRSREMIVGWQKKANAPATGFLTAAQRDQLLRAAAPAVTRWDEEQKKIEEQKKTEDEKKKSEATQTATAPGPSGSGASAPPVSGSSGPGVTSAAPSKAATIPDGTYRGSLAVSSRLYSLEVRMGNGSGTGTVTSSACGIGRLSLSVDTSGTVIGEAQIITWSGCGWGPAHITGRADGSKLLLVITGLGSQGGTTRGEATLILGGPAIAAAGPAALPSPDGLWRGTFKCDAAVGGTAYSPEFAVPIEMHLADGKGTWKNSSPNAGNGYTQEMRISVEGNQVQLSRFQITNVGSAPGSISGTYDGNTIAAAGREKTVGNRQCTLTLRRA